MMKKWAPILKSLLLLLFSLVLIIGGAESVLFSFERNWRGFHWQGLGSIVIGLGVALLALPFIAFENWPIMKWLRLVFKALLLLFGGWLLFAAGSCFVTCGRFLENNWWLAVGGIIAGMGAVAHALPFIPAAVRIFLGFLTGLVLLSGGGLFFYVLLAVGQDSIGIDMLPGLLLYMLLPVGAVCLGVWLLTAAYKFFTSPISKSAFSPTPARSMRTKFKRRRSL